MTRKHTGLPKNEWRWPNDRFENLPQLLAEQKGHLFQFSE